MHLLTLSLITLTILSLLPPTLFATPPTHIDASTLPPTTRLGSYIPSHHSTPTVIHNFAHPDLSTLTSLLSPSHLSSLPTLFPVKTSTSPDFYKGCCPVSPTLLSSLFSPPPPQTYSYFATYATRHPSLAPLLPAALSAGLFPSFPHAPLPSLDEMESSHQVWIGSPNATTLLHLDPVANMYFQAFGCKKFALVAPGEHGAALPVQAIFPRHHMLHWGSRRRLDEHPESAVSWVTLCAGDILYLPEGYLHEVTALGGGEGEDTSISVNFWTTPPLIAALDTLWDLPLPLAPPLPPLSPVLPLGAVGEIIDAFEERLFPSLAPFFPADTLESLRAALAPMYRPTSESPSRSPVRPAYEAGENIDHVHHAKFAQASLDDAWKDLPRALRRRPRCSDLDAYASLAPTHPIIIRSDLDALISGFLDVIGTVSTPVEASVVVIWIGNWVDDLLGIAYGVDHNLARIASCLFLSSPPPPPPPIHNEL